MSDDIPEAARDIVAWQRYQQKQYEEKKRLEKDSYHADMSAFMGFAGELSNEQLNFMWKMLEELGTSTYSLQYQGMVIAERIHRGLTADGRSYEEALGVEQDEVDEAFDSAPRELEGRTRIGPGGTHLVSYPESGDAVFCGRCGTSWSNYNKACEDIARNDGCRNCQHKEKWG